VPGVLSAEECAELTFIHCALGAAGYSPHLWTSKLSDIAYAEPALLIPVVSHSHLTSAIYPMMTPLACICMHYHLWRMRRLRPGLYD
jgi:hypothetical protein